MEEDLSISDFKMRDERALLPMGTVTPRGQWMLVSPITERLSEILEVPTTARDRIVRGMVLALGPKVRSALRVGDVVWFSQIQRYEIDGGRWLIRDANLAFVDDAPAESPYARAWLAANAAAAAGTDQALEHAERAIAEMERIGEEANALYHAIEEQQL